ncbi:MULTISPECIES: fluoride efflux transporter CrcB [unclassified Paenarthrobacter]|uniref:fluoride efflux transporter CrcB n=1 Tax=unclassified Paenarthrobacter TaxID=2634190 RepID=UPI00084EC012|nr:fluoride efflux transporter CrcB [Paenarthrobacter sp. R1]NKR13611.1 chromosome condensation protein CrcB [Arthrobacter sp. M5]NKR15496.1 chromosome condensation protein CrcB [Arthrobacter sp. M6]OEH58493.1 chromosome condensation protein CrcB [Arthrobacter sp. D2]OEH64369.1 chromosome condensation protein CrcB [Arthrobacter sp. D4]WIV33305.1 fluoride efflux transporter CrcB [Paenarthrobacter sp. R1]
MTIVLLGLAGGFGAGARFMVDGLVRATLRTALPAGTIAINVTGSFLLGVLTGAVLVTAAPVELQVIAGTGFLGGYTTFSTASFETVRLIQSRRTGWALLNSIGTAAASVGAAAAGLALAALL